MQHPITLIRSVDALGFTLQTEQPVTEFVYDKIGIDEVRQITQQALLRPTRGVEYTFVVKSQFVTHEAQNALLKLLEEPPAGLSFCIVLPGAVGLLPTLLSRVGQEVWDTAVSDDTSWQEFIGATPAERLNQIETWHKTKNPVWLQTILQGVHSFQASKVPKSALPVLQLVGAKLATRGASNKMLLEHLALALPLRK